MSLTTQSCSSDFKYKCIKLTQFCSRDNSELVAGLEILNTETYTATWAELSGKVGHENSLPQQFLAPKVERIPGCCSGLKHEHFQHQQTNTITNITLGYPVSGSCFKPKNALIAHTF